MADLERMLTSLAPDVAWPETPPMTLRLETEPRRPRRRALLVVALATVAAALAAALAVPGARSAILRFFHLGGVTIERVQVAPTAPERPLTEDLGRVVGRRAAEAALGARVRLPAGRAPARYYMSGLAVSVVLAAPQPVLLTEFRSGRQDFLLKKLAALETKIEWLQVRGAPAVWLSGRRHVVFELPAAPPRMAGNVLIWQARGITYRLEGRTLGRSAALRLARQIEGT